jgi:hypothetical protein
VPIEPDIGGYLESWSSELKARQDRVRLLIGNAHWLSDGHHKEAIIREFLDRYLPSNLVVSRGFVRPSRVAEQCSPEIDILIVDPGRHPPLFNEGGLIIVPPSAVLAYFEIKTRFSRSTLRNALKSVCATQSALSSAIDAHRIWRCVCFFDAAVDLLPEPAATIVSQELARTARVYFKSNSSSQLTQAGVLPTCIVCISRFVGFIRGESVLNRSTLKWFHTSEISLACALADMFSSITGKGLHPSVSELDQMIEALPTVLPFLLTIAK